LVQIELSAKQKSNKIMNTYKPISFLVYLRKKKYDEIKKKRKLRKKENKIEIENKNKRKMKFLITHF
jgi:hypothetical protein